MAAFHHEIKSLSRLHTYDLITPMVKDDQQELTALEKAEREVIRHHIHLQRGNLSDVAVNAGCTRQTLYKKLKRYSLWSLVEKMRNAA